jgi:hypothetical protein
MEKTAGQGIEAPRARSHSLLFQPYQDDSRRDILTTLRAQMQPRQNFTQNDAALRQNFDAAGFRGYLEAQNKTKKTIKDIVNYAKLHAHVLESGDASHLMTLSPRNRHHAMTSLANMAKFQGRYDRWLDIRRRYSLKWSKGDSMKVFERFFDEGLDLDAMIQRVKRMVETLPPYMARVVKFACLVGLRPAEVIESVRLLTCKDPCKLYYNPERQTLEHFRFPDVFLRQTKKAYLSFITLDNLQPIVDLHGFSPTWNHIRLACYKVGVKMEMHLCRKIFASYLSQCGIQSEVIDFLQGRVSTSVFSRHYLTPGAGLKDRILRAVEELARQL